MKDIKIKYLKYKAKYLKLKSQLGSGLIFPIGASPLHKKLFSIVNYREILKEAGPVPDGFVGPPRPIPKLVESDFDTFFDDMSDPNIVQLYKKLIDDKVKVYKNYSQREGIYRVGIHQIVAKNSLTKLANNWGQPIDEYLYERYGKPAVDDILGKNGIRITAPVEFDPTKIDCNVDYIMNNDDIVISQCKNKDLYNVYGSCGDPSFLGSNTDIDDMAKDGWLLLLEAIKNKLEVCDGKVTIIVGPTQNKPVYASDTSPQTHINRDSITLLVNPVSSIRSQTEKSQINNYILYTDFRTNIKKLNDTANPRGLILYLDSYFPLTHLLPNSRLVLDKIGSMANNIKIVNRICGSCFRSLYYLVRTHDIEYINEPEQGNSYADTDAILDCFRK